MKKIIFGVLTASMLFACKTRSIPVEDKPIVASIDLVNVKDDKVLVSVDPARFTSDTTVFYIPKTVPGTYSTDNYGKFSENFKALDYKGKEMPVVKIDENSWRIVNSKNLDKVTYLVNDSFDWEDEGGVYSMAGTNILKDKNFLLNLHAFIGYFKDMKEKEYRLEISRPSKLIPGTSLTVKSTKAGENENNITDIYELDRYFEVIDNPIMYAKADTARIGLEGIEVLLSVYSPNNKFTARDLKPSMARMINAQKDFLGEIDNTSKYAILLYLAESDKPDAKNFGALEHHTSTVVVLPESSTLQSLENSMIDIVSHEFFHILTPLNVHSNEVHYFDYNDPKMSQHLWMYEGVTEYFANLFQVNQGLITAEEFYNRMVDKINISRRFDDTMPFTVMSRNILEEEYKDSYYNVYMKGALIGMALDIRLRELSEGQMGLLDLMKELSQKYGKDRPFADEELIDDIVSLTYPEVQDFFDTYVSGTTPIPYYDFFKKVGLEEQEVLTEVGYFLKGQSPYIRGDQQSMKIIFRDDIEMNSFLKELGIKGGETLKSINGTEYTIKNVYDLISVTEEWKEGDDIKMKIIRNGEEITLEGKVATPKDKNKVLVEVENASSEKVELRNAWLKA